MGGAAWPSPRGSSDLVDLLTDEDCTGEEKQFEAKSLLQKRGRTEAVTGWEEKVKSEGEVGRRIGMLEMFLLKVMRGSMIFQSRHFLPSENICGSQRKGADLYGNSTLSPVSKSGRGFCGRPTGSDSADNS